MATSFTKSTKLTFIIISLVAIFTSSKADQLSELKQTSMTLYFQVYFGGPNATMKPITFSADPWSFKQFGTIFCTDDPMNVGIDQDSAQVARAQGIYVTSALDGSNTHVLISIVFSNEEFDGSTLEVQGTSKQFERVREVAVVGGTGRFQLARGYATLETVHLDLSLSYSIIEGNFTLWHY
ncbi:hypothetical protein L6452_00787 [Arctium lappa]|uniref:Uncharacterized protein n=1 Tax=Arctium lappa TaxID=4217 RepID=A0ACB9FGB9_ARCLA|nr:hypothetical protein L6452_00787 [Arctium lappa]